jgi:hypothetical protein
MNRMNLLFLKAFLAPSKNHANHCKKLLYKLNKNAVKSQTATRQHKKQNLTTA